MSSTVTAVNEMRRRPGPPPGRPSAARQRILQTANRLFYAEGVRAVGTERVFAEAEVARATFYRHFPTKDDLVLAYVLGRLQCEAHEFAALRNKHPGDPLAVLESVGDGLVREASSNGFRGCPYLNVAIEYSDPNHPVRKAAGEHYRWLTGQLRALVVEAQHDEVEGVTQELLILRAGMMAIVATAGREDVLLRSYRNAWSRAVQRDPRSQPG